MRCRAIQTGGQSVEWDRKELGRDPRGCAERESVVAQSDWGGVAKSNGSLCLVHDRKRRWGLGSAPHEQSRKSKLSCDCSGRLFPPRRLKRRATRARASLALLAYWPPRTPHPVLATVIGPAITGTVPLACMQLGSDVHATPSARTVCAFRLVGR